MKKLLVKSAFAVAILLSAISFTGCGSTYYGTSSGGDNYYDYVNNNPNWAPSYYTGSRYYYFPDIETYYDLATRDFIVLNRGQWLFAPSIVAFYPTYDLFNSYIIILNRSVYQPWMHHQYYVRHYPRYYYIDYYDYSNIPYVRGFNENKKGAIYYGNDEHYKARPWDDRNIRSNRSFNYSGEDRRVQQETTRRVNQERASTANRTKTTSTASTATRKTDNTVTDSRSIDTNNTNRVERTQPTTSSTRSSRQSSTPTNQSQTEQQTTTTRRTTDTNYYGSPIGNPVRVESQMRRKESDRTSTGTSSSNRSSSSSTGSRR
ncbi:MAG: hypothetical protein ACK5KP_12890 [Paludibacteraceae bacterium]